MNYVSYGDLSKLLVDNLYKIPHDIDLIVGIPRSGLMVASLLALYLNKPFTDVEGLENNKLISNGLTKSTDSLVNSVNECNKILIVEDSIGSGQSIRVNKERIKRIGLKAKTLYLACYSTPGNESIVDFCLKTLDTPRIFEWNFFHHGVISKSCFDLDGVLCADPTEDENDDGKKYLYFIKNAKPKFIPSLEIGAIVTSRLEKYRSETEEWLKTNGIKYKELIMLDSTAKDRYEKGLSVQLKSNFYQNNDYLLFVESSEKQAIKINEITKKPVYCVDSNIMFDGDIKYAKKYNKQRSNKRKVEKIKDLLKRNKVINNIYTKIKNRK